MLRKRRDGTGWPARGLLYAANIDQVILKGTPVMKTIATLLAIAALTLAANSADAKGCLKGAVVGGVAGHYAVHHGVLGAVAGCIYGRRQARQQQLQQQQQGQAPAGQEKM